MKFRKGNSVEVLRREHDPCGSWFPGTIVSVDGNNYVVRYKFLLDGEGKLILEKVPYVDIRPLPRCKTANRWRIGDMAEVFDNQCWRVGKIAKVLQNNGYVVRLSGSIQLREFHKSNIRVRESWHNNQWSVTGKVNTRCLLLFDLVCCPVLPVGCSYIYLYCIQLFIYNSTFSYLMNTAVVFFPCLCITA